MNQQQIDGMNPNELYREESYTDQKLGNIRKLIPITADGSDDVGRPIQFVGSAQIMSPMGAIPLSFELDGTTIGEAAEDFADKAQKAIEEASAEIERVRREQASQIVVPGQGGGSGIIS
jgi:hypothetical protein